MNSLPTKTALTIRWLARIGSIVSAGLLLAFAFGGNEESVLSARGPEAVGLLFFPLGILVGMALGWRRELWGGLVTLGSLALFYLWHFRASGDFPRAPISCSSRCQVCCSCWLGVWAVAAEHRPRWATRLPDHAARGRRWTVGVR